jgi:Zn-dependent protease/CBS domain-containing protein
MGNSIRVGKILGIEIRLDYSWFLVFLLIVFILGFGFFPAEYQFGPALSLALGVIAALLLFACVLIHEISHSLVARQYGIEVHGITLFLFGGVAQIKGEPETPAQEFFIAGIGPVVSAALGLFALGVAWVLANAGTPLPPIALLSYLGWINLLLAVFNLIPGFPMDGGRILRSALWKASGDLVHATRWASFAGRGFGYLLIAGGVFLIFAGIAAGAFHFGGLWLIFIGWFLNNAAQAAFQQLLVRRALSEVPVTEAMLPDLPAVDAETRVDDFVNQYLLRQDNRLYPVSRDDEIVGLVTLDDVRKLDRQYWGVTAVGALARAAEQEQAVEDTASAWDALTTMVDADRALLLVRREGRVQGIVTQESIMRLAQRKLSLDVPAEGSRGRRPAAPRNRGLAP